MDRDLACNENVSMSRISVILSICIPIFICSSLQASSEECNKKEVSDTLLEELRGLQYRVRSGLDYDAIQSDLQRLRSEANCHEEKVLQAVAIEADAFSRSPYRALPALYLLYQKIDVEDQRYGRVLRALGKNYAMLGRTQDLQGLIDLHPQASAEIVEYWQTNLALAHAQNGDLEAAKATIDHFMTSGLPTSTKFQVAIAIYELSDDADRLNELNRTADRLFGILQWPRALEGMGDQRFEVLYRRRFDPALSDAAPLMPPKPRYPPRAFQRREGGHCDVRFDVSKDGKPINVSAECTSKRFTREAERAVSEVEFEPLVYKGRPYVRRDIVYPITFSIDPH